MTDIDVSDTAVTAADIIQPRESEEDREERRARKSIVRASRAT